LVIISPRGVFEAFIAQVACRPFHLVCSKTLGPSKVLKRLMQSPAAKHSAHIKQGCGELGYLAMLIDDYQACEAFLEYALQGNVRDLGSGTTFFVCCTGSGLANTPLPSPPSIMSGSWQSGRTRGKRHTGSH
jgi:hypothetical protein